MDWDEQLRQFQAELELAADLEGVEWVPLARVENELGVSRSTLRNWYRNGEIRSRLVDGPHGPTRLVAMEEVRQRAARSPRIMRRAERELSLEAQVALLQRRVDELEARVTALSLAPGAGAESS